MRVTEVRPIAGSTALPPGYPHPHASQEARAIAEAGMILRAQVGSGVHGTAISGQDDRDEMGICLEPPRFITGLARVPNGTGVLGPSVRFRQYDLQAGQLCVPRESQYLLATYSSWAGNLVRISVP